MLSESRAETVSPFCGKHSDAWQRIYCARSWSLLTSFLVRSPKCQIVTQQLHDECRVLVRVLSNIVKLCDCIFKCSPSHLTCFLWVLQDLVLENREIQCQAKTNRVRNGQVLRGHVFSCLVCVPGAFSRLRLCIVLGEFGNVAVVVGLHLEVEDLRLPIRGLWNKAVIQELQDSVADFTQLLLNFATILCCETSIITVAL